MLFVADLVDFLFAAFLSRIFTSVSKVLNCRVYRISEYATLPRLMCIILGSVSYLCFLFLAQIHDDIAA